MRNSTRAAANPNRCRIKKGRTIMTEAKVKVEMEPKEFMVLNMIRDLIKLTEEKYIEVCEALRKDGPNKEFTEALIFCTDQLRAKGAKL